MIEVKFKEAEKKDVFPALYATENRESVILVKKIINGEKLEGIALSPSSNFGEFSMSWPSSKYRRLNVGSEFTLKFIQQ